MRSVHCGPKELAGAVASALQARKIPCPPELVLASLFEVLYYASIKTEEARPTTLSVIYLDPANPDPNPPPRIRHERWNYVALAEAVPATVRNLVKLSVASDPRSSCFVVYPDENETEWFVWGLIDQRNQYYDFINYNVDTGPECPGHFQATVSFPGHIKVTVDYETIAELRVNNLVLTRPDVLRSGPIYEVLSHSWEKSIERVEEYARSYNAEMATEWSDLWFGEEQWLNTLCRLVIRIQNYHHGGAILIIPRNDTSGLNVKHRIGYSRLRNALEAHGKHSFEEFAARRTIIRDYFEPMSDSMPVSLHLEEAIGDEQSSDAWVELDGSIWFVSLLSRIDGLVLMTSELDVLGFGVEITERREPESVFAATDTAGITLRELDYLHFGTRHRSMMRYCAAVPGSIGLVISQDGDVRAMMTVNGKLIVWEDIKLQLDIKATRRVGSKGGVH